MLNFLPPCFWASLPENAACLNVAPGPAPGSPGGTQNPEAHDQTQSAIATGNGNDTILAQQTWNHMRTHIISTDFAAAIRIFQNIFVFGLWQLPFWVSHVGLARHLSQPYQVIFLPNMAFQLCKWVPWSASCWFHLTSWGPVTYLPLFRSRTELWPENSTKRAQKWCVLRKTDAIRSQQSAKGSMSEDLRYQVRDILLPARCQET